MCARRRRRADRNMRSDVYPDGRRHCWFDSSRFRAIQNGQKVQHHLYKIRYVSCSYDFWGFSDLFVVTETFQKLGWNAHFTGSSVVFLCCRIPKGSKREEISYIFLLRDTGKRKTDGLYVKHGNDPRPMEDQGKYLDGRHLGFPGQG